MFRFIHSSDLHLGKRFGNFEGDLPSRLREARHQVLAKLAALARENCANVILLAGDTFDSETPAADVRRQALAEMAAHDDIKWVILPGNHDSLQAVPLWEHVSAEVAGNIILALTPQPITLAPDVILLPAPVTTRRPGRDLTQWMDGYATAEGMIRLGLAHGAVRQFSETSHHDGIIAPDRAKRAHLDYLALGDWHGRLEVDPRSHYCGTPEPDRFKHEAEATALMVTIEAPHAVPQVKALPSAKFRWQTIARSLLDSDDPVTDLHHLLPLPLPHQRRQTLLRIKVSGFARLEARSRLEKQVDAWRPDFALLEFDAQDLRFMCEVTDLDMIDKSGALRIVADELLAEVEDPSRPQQARAIASAALARFYSYARRNDG